MKIIVFILNLLVFVNSQELEGEDNELLDNYYDIWRTIGRYPEGHFLFLFNQGTQLCLTVQLASGDVFAGQIVSLTCQHQAPYQKFTFHHAERGNFNISPWYPSGPSLTYLNNGATNSSSALLGRWARSHSHQYRFQFPANNRSNILLVNRGANNCLTAGFYTSGTPCEDDESRQHWQICDHHLSKCWPRDAPV